jgi:hypothetical protein
MDEGTVEHHVEEMQDLINRLPAVLRCTIVINDWGSIEEIHVLTTLERSPKQVVRDVESALSAKWDIHVDHKRISVAQIRTDDIVRTRQFLTIREVTVDVDTMEGHSHARVELEPVREEGMVYHGEWSGRYVPSHHTMAVAEATVQALNTMAELHNRLVLLEVRSLQVSGQSIMLAALSYLEPNHREDLLIGTCPEAGDAHGAAAQAVVDAVNRWMIRADVKRSEDPLFAVLMARQVEEQTKHAVDPEDTGL